MVGGRSGMIADKAKEAWDKLWATQNRKRGGAHQTVWKELAGKKQDGRKIRGKKSQEWFYGRGFRH